MLGTIIIPEMMFGVRAGQLTSKPQDIPEPSHGRVFHDKFHYVDGVQDV